MFDGIIQQYLDSAALRRENKVLKERLKDLDIVWEVVETCKPCSIRILCKKLIKINNGEC